MRSKLLKGASLFRCRVARRDDPDDFFMTYHMHNKQKRLGFRTPNGGVSGFVWPGRIHDAGEWIKKDLAGKPERHAVLHEIRVSLGGIPFKRDTVQTVPNTSIHSVLTKAIRSKSRSNAGFQAAAWRQGELRAAQISVLFANKKARAFQRGPGLLVPVRKLRSCEPAPSRGQGIFSATAT